MTIGKAKTADRGGELSNAAGAVLGMVWLGARSGYEIRRAGEQSLRFFWALSPPQIYDELRRLEEHGLLAGSDEARGQRPRRAFEVTATGERALREWLRAGEPAALEIRDGELLRLFFADALPRDELLARVALMRRRSERALGRFDAEILPAADETAAAGHAFPREVARFGVELHEFIVSWCDHLTGAVAEDAA